MSKKLALSSALSVLLMAGFALFGAQTGEGDGMFAPLSAMPARAELPTMPAVPALLPR